MMIIDKNNLPTSVADRHFTIRCPHCNATSNITAVSIPRYEQLVRFLPQKIGIGYRCDACNVPIFLRFRVIKYEPGNARVLIEDEFEVVERSKEQFEYSYLKGEVRSDFEEALGCFSNGNMNAFAAMCRRTVQSMCNDLGARGKDKVLTQLRDLKETAEIDDETFSMLSQIIIDGHDGAHPHLPKLNESRAGVLLVLMKDVMTQVYVRKAKLQEAMELRRQVIAADKSAT